MWNGDYMMGFGFGGAAMLLFWILLIALIVWVVRGFTGNPQGKTRSALDILEQRYAKGEIDKEEFEEKKRDLTS